MFSQRQYNGCSLSFSDEQKIVSAVHNPTDEKLITKILQESYGRWDDMNAAIFRGEREGRTRLIRKVDSRMLLVHDNPLQILNPYAWRGFSLFQGTLRGWIKELREIGRASCRERV